MADFLDDGEFWLPPKFLADDEALIDNPFAAGPFEHPFVSELGSPVDSTETESDEDDLLADLSRKMTRSALENSGYRGSVRVQTGSPQSTLRPATWDLLYEAATEVAKMRLAEELYGHRAPISVPGKAINSDTLRFAQSPVPYHQFLDYQIQQFKRQQMIKQHHQHQQRSDAGDWEINQKSINDLYAATKTCTAARRINFPSTRNGRQVGLSPTAWPSLQQAAQPSSGMGPVFLRTPAGKRECTGTGVFLPRRAESSPPELRKKPVCSTALLPTKVVHALDMNMETVFPQSHVHRFNGVDVACNVRRNYRQNRSIPSQMKASTEIGLPQEWTY